MIGVAVPVGSAASDKECRMTLNVQVWNQPQSFCLLLGAGLPVGCHHGLLSRGDDLLRPFRIRNNLAHA